jgi:hypothetical protein
MQQEITTEIGNIVEHLSKIENDDNVKTYLQLIQRYDELEEVARKHVEATQDKISYYSIKDKSLIQIAPAVKTKYDTSVQDVQDRWGNKYILIEPQVNIDMMKESPECTPYLESIKSETIYTRKTKIKEKNIF